MRPFAYITTLFDVQRGHLFPWLPVFFAAGIGIYFALASEPGLRGWVGLSFLALAAVAATVMNRVRAPLLVALTAVIVGILVAGWRTHSVAEPVLSFRYYGPVKGRIVNIDRSRSGAVRLTLDRVILSDVRPSITPSRVRVSLHGDQRWITPEPGLTVILTGHLSPPGGPVEPGGFDFRRQAWFKKLGAVGYTRTPALTLFPARDGHGGLMIFRIRMAISNYVQDALPGQAGAFAAAITTGDRSGIDVTVLEDLRASNLAHLLAISGLHMGLLTGFVFASIRYGFAAIPRLALIWPTKKIAAGTALIAGAGYLALSGGNVATERAFIMIAVMFIAVIFDRRALTLRAVALAAMIVLALRPEALLGPGFQMSFAATTALVAVFGWARDARDPAAPRRIPRWLFPVIAVVVSSLVAGLATAPIAAAHFNRVPHYGLIANLLSVPLMGTVVIPSAVLAALFAPLGLGWVGLKIMEYPILWILAVAERVSGWDGSISHVPTPPSPVLPLLISGLLFVVLWQGRARVGGFGAAALALILWTQADRPDLLVSETGGLVGLMTDEGRAVSKARGEGFAASSWLENDGDGADQAGAFERVAFDGARGTRQFMVGEVSATHLSGRGAADRVAEACARSGLVILSGSAESHDGCKLVDRDMLRKTGALAIYADPEGLQIVTASERTGRRPWNSRQ